MKKNFLARMTSFVLMIMLAFTMIPSGMVFADEPAFSIELTADKMSVAKDGILMVTVTAKGDFKDIIGLQYGLVYDPTEFSVDTENTGSRKEPRYDNLFDETWFDANSINDYTGVGEGLDTLEVGTQVYKADNTKELLTVLWYTGDPRYYINSDVEIYGAKSVELGKVKLKALKDVANVATAVTLVNQEITWVGSKVAPSVAVQIPNLDMAAVNNVNALISAIPATVTYADKAKVEAAKTAYTALGDAEKALVTGAEKITSAETLIAAMETAIANVETLINAIGDVIYPDSKAKIDAARSAYDALADDAQKAAVDNYSTLTAAEADYAALEGAAAEEAANRAAAAAVDAKIEAIGTVKYTAASKALIDAADAAYKALTSTQQGLVTKKDELDLAIATYKALGGMVDTAEEEFKALEGKTITIADEDAVMLLKSTFDALQPEQIVALDAKLGYSSTDKFNEYVSAYETSCAKVSNVKALINAIGAVTLESGSAIESAENAYAQLLDVEKTYIDNHNTLTEARATYDELVEEAAQNAANKAAAEAVDAKIEAIGTVVYTSASKALIDDAKAAYQALTPAQQALVTKKAELDDKDKQYSKKHNRVKSIERMLMNIGSIEEVTIEDGVIISDLEEWLADLPADEIAALDRFCDEFAEGISTFADTVAELRTVYNAILAKVENVKALIAGLGTVTLESGDAIVAAENAYKALTNNEKEYVTNYATLTKAREDYNTLVTYKEAADEVVDAICALPSAASVTKDNVDTVVAKLASAKASYENLPDKTMVAGKYLEMLADIEEACNVVKADLAAAKDVDDLIAAIGTVSLESLNKIEAAEAAYDELSDMAQSYVTKKYVLDNARVTYDELKADQDAIDAVEDLIAAIGDVTLDSECLNTIAAAKDAYDALDADLQPRVENYTVLTNALATYEALVTSKAKVDAVIAAIDNLGEITLASKAKIEAAEALYGALTDDEQAQVENYQTLLDARATYEELKEAADKAEADQLAANGVDELIGEIGEVTLGSEAAIVAARAAYDNLTDDQKALVSGLSILEEAEAILEGLKADKAAVDAVIEIINEIGEVTYPDSKDAIDAAQAAYDDLADNLKDQVANKGVLDNAIAKYAALEADYNAVQNVIGLIDAIGEVEYTVDCKERIDAADEAYLALRDELRDDVTNADVLEAAKAKYEELKPEFAQTQEPVSEYGDMYMTVFSNIPEGKKVTLGGIEALMYKENEAVYYLVLSSTVINPEEVVVEDGSSASILMGDTNGDGKVDGLDAFATNNKSANHEVDAYLTDAMAYVRSDINGSGTITAYDALMIARIAAGVQGVVINFVAGK